MQKENVTQGLPTYEESLQRYYQRVYRTLCGKTDTPQQAEDIVQEVFVKAYFAWSRLKPESNILQWLYAIARNELINNYRRHKQSRQEASLEAILEKETSDRSETTVQELADDSHNVLETYIEQEALTTLFQQLPEKPREVLLLLGNGYSYQDIADIQGTTIGTIASRVSRARNMLLHLLQAREQ